MKNQIAVLSAWLACTTMGVPGDAPVPAPVPYGPVPSARQLQWHELELYGMVNFSTITYYGKEWGYGDEDPARFDPREFDARQIVRAARAGGLRGLIIDAKHHGGFCLWPSKYTSYSVQRSPWRKGQGDMVKELAEACRAEGLQVAIYLSPWDRNHPAYGRPEYVTYFRNQLTELLSGYGPVFAVWFDGANGGDGYYGGARETRNISRRTYYDFPDIIRTIVHRLQPGACVFSDLGPDIRWNGSETGISGDPCWATFTPKYRATHEEVRLNPETGYFYEMPVGDSNYDEAPNGHRHGKMWLPAEADFPLRGGWFWQPGDRPKTPAHLVNLYFASVGRNSALDVGLAPDRRGLICDEDAAALAEFGRRLRDIFGTDLAQGAQASASQVRGGDPRYAAANVLAGEKGRYWATDDAVTAAELTLDFGRPVEFSVVSLREQITLGHRVDEWALDAAVDGGWREFASGTAIGARRLWRGQPITSAKLRLRITQAAACPAIAGVAVHLEPAYSRAEAGNALAARREPGLSREGWKIISASCEAPPGGAAANAIDGQPNTFWHTHTEAGRQPPPQEIVVDTGQVREIAGFLYLPRQDACTVGNVAEYAFYLSENGRDWGAPAARGEFGNIKANPIQQKVMFAKPVPGRFFKFVALRSADAPCINVAELGLVGK